MKTPSETRRRRRLAQRIGGVALMLAALPALANAETVYVRAGNAALKDAATASGTTLVELARGDAISVVSRDGSWIKGSAANKTGWVHALKVSADKPAPPSQTLAGLGGDRDDYIREAESGRGARGLDETAEEYARSADLSEAAIAAVKRMETRRVSSSDVAAFLREGRLGEFAP